ncbi:MAG TPA: hypothetical protein VG820_00970 [Fimbriimonadaceae bacterium]|nr:hypothetical protein [Fimbriimonadaceae bacterium]
MNRPLYVYDNWSAYDELSDSIPLTEELAMFQLDQVLRLRRHGVQMDAYLMDAFWYEREGGYRAWKRDRWPEGPGRWLDACLENGLTPGLWFPANTVFDLEVPAAWQDSLAPDKWGLCCFEGGFLDGFVEVLEHWYERGVRIFKFDFADFGAAPEATRLRLLPSEIRARNCEAYRAAMAGFLARCPEAKLLAYNGFEEAEFMTWTDRPIRRLVDPRWLDVFESIYAGDPRPADLPLPDFWRAVDVYADQMVRFAHGGGLPLERIDNCAFMIGVAGTCYRRGVAGWKAALLLSLARGGRVHMTLGNLELLSDEDAAWFAQAQELYRGAPAPLGGIPGRGEAYGYLGEGVATLVNPSLETKAMQLEGPDWRVAFANGGVSLAGPSEATLGPGAVAVFTPTGTAFPGCPVTGEWANGAADAAWRIEGRRASATIQPGKGDLHVLFEQRDGKGLAVRTAPSTLEIEASSGGVTLPVERVGPAEIWSGISWAYGILRSPGVPVDVVMRATDPAVSAIVPRAFFRTS